MRLGYFITGTDTGVGKTRVAVAMVSALKERGLRVAAMKPVASGADETPDGLRNDDALQLQCAANLPTAYDVVNPYCFSQPIAPHLAARHMGVRIDIGAIMCHFAALAQQADAIIVEGVGGWLVPLGSDSTSEDLAAALGLPVILVVGLRLGCINHALLTARAIAARGLELKGWIANAIDEHCACRDEIVADLTARLGAAPLAEIPHGHTATDVDWSRL